MLVVAALWGRRVRRPSAASDILSGGHSLNATVPELRAYCRCATLVGEQSWRPAVLLDRVVHNPQIDLRQNDTVYH